MIYTIFSDRLGNNLFQLAAALNLSKEVTICVPLPNEYQEVLKFKELFFKGLPIINYIPDGIQVYEEPYYHYSKIPYSSETDLVIKGYFQSYKYFERKLILSQFSIDRSVLLYIENNFPEIIYNKYTSIHVRRGDYLDNSHKHPFCGLSYYKKAIKIIGEKKNYIILSDDIEWCKKNIKLDNVKYVEGTSPIIDFYIQALCLNNIISNSSFSWWGAYLNNNIDKIVIAPSLWFGFKFKVDTKDLLPSNYTIIKNRYSFNLIIKSLYKITKNKLEYVFKQYRK